MAKPKPTHYKVVCFSMYTRDIDELEAKVAELKARGWSKANKSLLIRLALAQLDVTTLPIPRSDDASKCDAPSAASSASAPTVAASRTTSRPPRPPRPPTNPLRLRPLTSHEIDLARKRVLFGLSSPHP